MKPDLHRPPARLWASLLFGCALFAAAAASQAAPPAVSRIAFAVDNDASGRTSRIYLVNSDGSDLKAFSLGVARDRDPAFSPTGKTIAYQTNPIGVEQIVVRPADGGPIRVLVDGGGRPQWSRDGQRILFARRLENKDRLFVIKSDGTQKDAALKPLTDGRIGRWSPDEKQLATAATAIVDKADHWQIRVVPADQPDAGSRKTLTLPEDWGPVLSLEWSPDATRLLFSVARQNRNELYVLDLNSPEPRKVPSGDGLTSADYGSWSPDGKEIVFRASDASSSGDSPGGVSRLCLMKADGTGVRALWEPDLKTARVHGTAWYRSPTALASIPMPKTPVVVPMPAPMPAPMPMPPPVGPTQKVLGPPQNLHANKLFAVQRARSPVTVNLAVPGASDFTIAVPVLPSPRYRGQRQGVGITLELEDGSLYRGNVIYSTAPWVTLQGRAKGGKVRLIDGKQLTPEVAGFKKGFTLGIRREAANMVLSLNGQDVLARPVLSAPVTALSLTLENFDVADAKVPLGGVTYRQWIEQPIPPK